MLSTYFHPSSTAAFVIDAIHWRRGVASDPLSIGHAGTRMQVSVPVPGFPSPSAASTSSCHARADMQVRMNCYLAFKYPPCIFLAHVCSSAYTCVHRDAHTCAACLLFRLRAWVL